MVFSLITVFLVTVYPYLPALNPTGRFVGVDIPFYEKKLLELNSLRDFPSIVSKAFISYADRPVSILLLFFGWKLTWLSAVEAAQFSPIILGLILVFATYMFARLLGFTQFSASMVMLFTSFSFHITVGMYGGFIANWIGLIFYYLFWGFLCLAMRSGSWLHCLTSMAFLGLLMFSHAETWGMSMGVLLLLFSLHFLKWIFKRRSGKNESLMLLAVLCFGALLNLARNAFLNVGLGKVEAVGVAQTSVSLGNLLNFWGILSESILSFKGISFINPLLDLLAFIGSLAVFLNRSRKSEIFKALIIGSSPLFLLGDRVLQTRIMYNLPIQIFALIGLYTISSALESRFEEAEAEKLKKLLTIYVILVNVNYALRCSFHLTTINFFPG